MRPTEPTEHNHLVSAYHRQKSYMLHREKLRNIRDEPRPVFDQRFCEQTEVSQKNRYVAVEYLEKEKA